MRRMHRTYTFDFFTFWPRWRSYSFTPEPIRWLWFRWFDFVPLLLVLTFAAELINFDPVIWATAIWYFGIFPFVVWRRLSVRRRGICRIDGHIPYWPMPGELECLRCGHPLDVDDYAEARMRDVRARPQAFYSDRR